MMAGVMLVVMGVTGLGRAVRFIPRPVVVGFTNGIAVLIASTQLRDFFGIDLKDVPGELAGAGRRSPRTAGSISPLGQAAVGAVVTLAFYCRGGELAPRPGSDPRAVRRARCRCSSASICPWRPWHRGSAAFRAGYRTWRIPALRVSIHPRLLMPAITVALLGAIESLMSAVVADSMSGDQPRSEHGAGRTGRGQHRLTDVRRPSRNGRHRADGHQHPIRGQDAGGRASFTALTLLVILLVAAPLAGAIPMAVLAAILMVVSYNMGEWR